MYAVVGVLVGFRPVSCYLVMIGSEVHYFCLAGRNAVKMKFSWCMRLWIGALHAYTHSYPQVVMDDGVDCSCGVMYCPTCHA